MKIQVQYACPAAAAAGGAAAAPAAPAAAASGPELVAGQAFPGRVQEGDGVGRGPKHSV